MAAGENSKNFEKFKNLSAGLQSIAAIVALAIAAAWAWYTWGIQRQDRRQSLFPAIEITISAKQETSIRVNRSNERLIRGCITIRNVGTQTTIIPLTEWDKPKSDKSRQATHGPIFIAKAKPTKKNKMQFGEEQILWLSKPVAAGRPDIELQDEIRPQATDHYEFLAWVREPGIYAVMFSTGLDETEIKRMRDAGIDVDYDWRWEQTTFVKVK